jgi:hypothetical protein
MTMYIKTPYGDSYRIHENGDIQRLDQRPVNKPFHASGQWKMLGIQHVKKSLFIPLESVFTTPPKELRYKNGNPQWTVRDLDHGTERVWGNTKHHGIAEIRILA